MLNDRKTSVLSNCGVKFTYLPTLKSYEGIALTCYFRHLGKVFEKAGIKVNSQNRMEIDKIIRNLVGANSVNCSVTWREVKNSVLEDEAGFVSILKEAWKKNKS